MVVVVRFAPSPTGLFHLGGARTALFNYLFARQNDGKFILRVDDTDKERSRPEFEADIKEGLQWLSLDHDEFYRQSERTAVYKKYLEKLIAEGKVYQTDVLRFRNPGGEVRFQDIIRGEIEFAISDLGDFVVAKDLETPLYHFASVVDDLEMAITHVIRGEDHISNTPRQILLCQALGSTPPLYAHLPLILAPDRTKLSKRHGAVAISDYRRQGYLPEALVNFLALLGWSPQAQKLEREIFSLSELVRHFRLEDVQPSPAIFNLVKLNWFNREYLKRLPASQLLALVKSHLPEEIKTLPGFKEETLSKLLPELTSRLEKLVDIREMAARGELSYYFAPPIIDKKLLHNQKYLAAVTELLSVLPEEKFTAEVIKNTLWDLATKVGRAEVFWPMRAALTGRERSPDPFTVAAILGKPETINRLRHAQTL